MGNKGLVLSRGPVQTAPGASAQAWALSTRLRFFQQSLREALTLDPPADLASAFHEGVIPLNWLLGCFWNSFGLFVLLFTKTLTTNSGLF